MFSKLPASRRLHQIRWANCIALIVTLLFASRLWHSHRDFPLAPVFDFLPALPALLNFLILATAFINISLSLSTPGRLFQIVVVASLSLLILFDINRLQPEFYMMLTLMLILIWYNGREHRQAPAIQLMQLVWIGIYVNSGFHKINPWFNSGVFSWMTSGIQPAIAALPDQIEQIFYSRGWLLVPMAEIGAGILLFFRKTRKAGIWLAVLMHLSIVYTVVILDHNLVILPWNLLMLGGVFLLFRGDYCPWRELLSKHKILAAVMILLYFLLPFTHYFYFWDRYPSYAIYSGKHQQGYLAVEEYVYRSLPQQYRRHMYRAEKENKYIADLDTWSLEETGAPIYAEKRIYVQYKKHFEKYAANPQDVFLVIIEKGETEIIR